MINIREKIVSVLYPRQCPVCREIVYPKGDTICRECRNGLPYISGPRCRKCSKPVHNEVVEYCYDCSRKKHFYNEGISLFEHKGSIKDAIYDIKYNNKREYLDFFADEIVLRCGDRIKGWQDCHISVDQDAGSAQNPYIMKWWNIVMTAAGKNIFTMKVYHCLSIKAV